MKRLALIALLGLSACEKIDYIEIAPSEVVFKEPTNQKWMEARAMARNGVRAVKARVAWSVKDGSVAKVDGRGLLEPVADGDTELVAKAGDVEARIPVQVVFVDRIEVEPKELTLTEGAAASQVTVKAFRKNGKLLTDRTALFTSDNKAVAQVVAENGILPLDPGTATITVQVEGARASVKVTVEPEKTKK